MGGLAEDSLDESPAKVWLKRIGMALVLLAIVVGGWLLFSSLLSSKVSMKKPVTTVKLLPDTPPPPPPPPKEPPKEQPKEQPKEIKVEPPKQQEPQQPPAEALKMEGAAGDGPSPFAAGSVTNDYKGGEPMKIGGGTNIRQFSWYTGMLKTQIEDALAKNKKLSSGDYKVVVKVWVSSNGHIERYELSGTSGKQETDELIRAALGEMPPLAEGPPQDMPQPVKLRISARSSG